MELLLLMSFPVPLRLLAGMAVLITGVLLAFWFFMAKNNPRSQKVDDLPADSEARKLRDQFDRREISEEEYHRRLADLEKDPQQRP
jgi:uncharacterized membrane protein